MAVILLPSVALLTPTQPAVNLTNLLQFVLPDVPACPDVTAIFNIRQAAIEFCQKTMAWQEYQPDLNTVEGRTTYEHQLDADRAVHKLLMVLLDGRQVDIVQPEHGRGLDSREATVDYAYSIPGGLEIRPAPKGDLLLRTYAALVPTQLADTLPAEFERHFDAIANGAKARLLAMPSADWKNPNEAQRLRGEFLARISTVARAVARGHSKPRRDPSARFY